MRRVLVGDLLALAAVLRQQPDPDLAARLLAEAHAAHRYFRRFGRPHPRWGNGSLMGRALPIGGGLLADWSPAGLQAMGMACTALAEWQLRPWLACPAPNPCAKLPR